VIYQFLNKRHSTRSLSDQEFAEILPALAQELTTVNFIPQYSDEELLTDWQNLLSWAANGNTINSTNRVGMKLCEHFFPNFWDIKDNKGNSFCKLWRDPIFMQKVLIWNRKSHSTPYLSELRRGVYFCSGLCKSTMYRPQIAKMITKNHKRVLDPCMGWGGRLLGTVASGADYVGFDPNIETYTNLNTLVDFLDIRNKVNLICDDALKMDEYSLGLFDVVLTSPPYFDLEIYADQPTQSIFGKDTYKSWNKEFLTPLIAKSVLHLNRDGKSCWNVAKVKTNDIWDSVTEAHSHIGFCASDEYGVQSSARQVNQPQGKNKKSIDRTVVYTRKV
jgi:hypothetical protein